MRFLVVIVFLCFLLASGFWAHADSYDNSNSPIEGYQPEKSIPGVSLPPGEALSFEERGAIQLAGDETQKSLSSDSPPGSDPIQQAKNTSTLGQNGNEPKIHQRDQNPDIVSQRVGEPKKVSPDDRSYGLEPSREPVEPFDLKDLPGRKRLEKNLDPKLDELLKFIRDKSITDDELEAEKSDFEKGTREAIDQEFDRQLNEKIEEILPGIKVDEEVGPFDIIVLDTVEFTRQIKAIHRLMNPPARLHPWLKWLLYLDRVSPQMLDLYQAALEKRDQIYSLASKSNGKLKIRYQGKVMDIPIFVWPDEAEGSYDLVMVRNHHSPISSHSSPSVPVSIDSLPS